MVERQDMGAEKLDTVAYTWAALHALEEMASVMGDTATAAQACAKAAQIESSFDATWWDAASGSYAMSLNESDNARKAVPHWAVITPLEVRLATPEHTTATLATIQASYLNQWGLKHTVGADERVWTLPTATLSRAAFRSGQPELGLEMLRRVAGTLDAGSAGFFHELIPDGLCTIQLWSSATFVRGVVEDLVGLEVRADLGAVTIAPRLQANWQSLALDNLSFAGHKLAVRISAGSIQVQHVSGPAELVVKYRSPAGQEESETLAPGQNARFKI